jgi:WD40 repeat protein
MIAAIQADGAPSSAGVRSGGYLRGLCTFQSSDGHGPAREHMLTGGRDGTLRVWDSSNWKLVEEDDTLARLGLPITSLTVSPDNRLVCVTLGDWTLGADKGGGGVALWDTQKRRIIRQAQRDSCVNDAVFDHRRNQLWTASHDGHIYLWALEETSETWEPVRGIPAHDHWVWSLSIWDEHDLLLSVGHDQAIKQWNLADLSKGAANVKDDSGEIWHTVGILCSALHENGYLATGSFDNSVILWDLKNAAKPKRLVGHIGPVAGVAFSPQGNTLASSSWDGTVRLWNVETGREISLLRRQDVDIYSRVEETFSTHQEFTTPTPENVPLLSLVFCRNGTALATGDQGGFVHFWYALKSDRQYANDKEQTP